MSNFEKPCKCKEEETCVCVNIFCDDKKFGKDFGYKNDECCVHVNIYCDRDKKDYKYPDIVCKGTDLEATSYKDGYYHKDDFCKEDEYKEDLKDTCPKKPEPKKEKCCVQVNIFCDKKDHIW